MHIKPQLSFFTLLLMISFASVNAVLFTPALPAIAQFFAITEQAAQLTITWFLIGYALGQLIYGPFANRFGRKPTLYAGIFVQILSSFLCVLAGFFHDYSLLVLGRLFLALGSGVGLKMTFTLVNESYEPHVASQKLSYLMIAFAITPGLGVMLGGYFSAHFGWGSTFILGALYGVILLVLTTKLPETKKNLDRDALKMNHLVHGYAVQFKNAQLIAGGLLMSGATCFIYVFAAFAPFIAMNLMHMDVSTYGTANLLPPIGLVVGSLVSAQLAKKYQSTFIIALGIFVTLIGSSLMFLFIVMSKPALLSLFLPMMLCYFGLSLIFANASALAMSNTVDKAHGSAVMNFINMGLATVVVLSIGMFSINYFILPTLYIGICIFMAILNLYFYAHPNSK
jgi:MFS transporter, DHA1 family, multidrug resistance protein